MVSSVPCVLWLILAQWLWWGVSFFTTATWLWLIKTIINILIMSVICHCKKKLKVLLWFQPIVFSGSLRTYWLEVGVEFCFSFWTDETSICLDHMCTQSPLYKTTLASSRKISSLCAWFRYVHTSQCSEVWKESKISQAKEIETEQPFGMRMNPGSFARITL